MSKIPFKVSARTAKLIGQENFSNPEGAIIELVKNCYDADAKSCFVIFDVAFSSIPDFLSKEDFNKYSNDTDIIKKCYKSLGDKFSIINNLNEISILSLQKYFFSKNSLYIIDNGDGMNKNIIQNQWMEIGTGNKETQSTSDDGRVKTGAKGIGRFALDRLGHLTEMWTIHKKEKQGHYWRMDWTQFDIPNKNISEIEADLISENFNLKNLLTSTFKSNTRITKIIPSIYFENGTIIKISNLKDSWNENDLENVFKNLEALIPPKALSIPFEVHFFHLQSPKIYGEVETAFFNDFDYKLSATFNSKTQSIDITVTRNELDLDRIKSEFKYIFKNALPPYDISTITKKTFKYSKSIYEILKWEESKNSKSKISTLGDFTFTFFYLKNQTSNKEGYPFKTIEPQERKSVLEKFGGIKIYRDSFRVRPYGDPQNDWLKLGERQNASPAGAGQRIGDWRVGTNQVAGIINISRINNSQLIDKSDRAALIENDTFDIFKKTIIGIIYEFELDRSKILNPFYLDIKAKEDKLRQEEIKKEAKELVVKIFKNEKTGDRKEYERIFEKSFLKFEKKEDDDAEIAQVRTLASLGLIVSSFAHELKEVKNNFADFKELESIYKTIVSDDRKKQLEYSDGLNIINLLKKETLKISHWVDYSITAIKKDKRKRGILRFEKYFQTLANDWKNVLSNRNITLEFKNGISEAYQFRAFEMDMNTIFSNLIANSIDSFNNLKTLRDRKINVSFKLTKNRVQIIYSDNGKGIPRIFKKNIDEIFLPFTTSKKDNEGNDIGTGLGMYLVKNVVKDNNGTVEILEPEIGFKIKIEFPIRKK